ncbi:MAG: OsmC family protein [Dehalococcoidia bacterium]
MASHAAIRWVEGHRLVAADEFGASIVIDSKEEDHEPQGFRPVTLLLASLAGCVAYDVVEILQKQRQTFTALAIDVQGEQDADPPWTFRRIHMTFTLRGEGLDRAKIEHAVQLSEEKYCSVAATLRPNATITTSVVIEEEARS